METGCDTTCNSYEEYREEGCTSACITSCIPQRVQTEYAIPAVGEVDVHQFITFEEDTEEYTNCGQQQDSTEDRVDSTDDFVDREQCCDQVICQDYAVDYPCTYGNAFDTNDLVRKQVTRCVSKYSTNQQHQDAQEDVVNLECFAAQEFTNDTRHLCAVLTQRHHTAQVVVNSTADYTADRDSDECDGPEQNTLDGTKDRAGTCLLYTSPSPRD